MATKRIFSTSIVCVLMIIASLSAINDKESVAAGETVKRVLPDGKRPHIRSIQLGNSVQGRPIRMHLFGQRGPVVLIFAAKHGDEPESQYVAQCLIDYLLTNEQLYRDRRVAIIPTTNPDGVLLNTRVNANHVDLNRNFPASNYKKTRRVNKFWGGLEAGSEPETQAIMLAVNALKPRVILSIHVAIKESVPFCMDPDTLSAMKLAKIMSKHNGYPVIEDMGYNTPGSFGTWAGKDRDILTITLELRDFQPWPELWEKHRDALIAVIEYTDQKDDSAVTEGGRQSCLIPLYITM